MAYCSLPPTVVRREGRNTRKRKHDRGARLTEAIDVLTTLPFLGMVAKPKGRGMHFQSLSEPI